MNITVLFPDNNSDMPTSGGFQNQDEFRDFLFKNPGCRVRHAFHARPTANRQNDYDSDEFVQAFPLQFPYGYAGFPKQQLMQPFFEKVKSSIDTNDLLRHFLRHRKKEFHMSEFNLVTNGLLMKNEVFQQCRLQCNMTYKDAKQVGEKFGGLSASDVNNSIAKARAEVMLNPSSDPGDQFLRSVSAICADLPHSNEASVIARDEYFSMIVRFGLPALFVTISPDDQRSVWIRVYLLKDEARFWQQKPDIDLINDADLVAEYRERVSDRVQYPGLCAEDYTAITEVFVKHVLQWSSGSQEAKDEGLFGFTEAFTQATEEQGRKTLHGHFLIWIKDWNDLLHRVMEKSGIPSERKSNLQLMTNYVRHCASASMFQDFQMDGPLSGTHPFEHDGCKSGRETNSGHKRRYEVAPVSDEQLHEMRKCDKCYEHKGHIATCKACRKAFSIEDVATTCLNGAFRSDKFDYADKKRRRLDRLVYEMQKDFNWQNSSPEEQATRRLASNINTNLHNVTHTPRCFKKEPICYTKFPVQYNTGTTIRYAEEPHVWADYDGTTKEKFLFEIVPERPIEEVYTNVHNPILTLLFLCNNNILAAMTGAVVLYVTSYSSKKNQKEERTAFEKMALVIFNLIEKQVS